MNVLASQVFLNSSLLGWVEWKGIGLTVQRPAGPLVTCYVALRTSRCCEGLGLVLLHQKEVQEAGTPVSFS